MRVLASTSYFSTNAAVVLEGSDKIVSTNYEITSMTRMENGSIVFIDGDKRLITINKNGAEERIMDVAESMLIQGDQLIAASNRHLHFFVCRGQGEFKFLKKIKIIGNDEDATVVDLATQGHAILSIDAHGQVRVTSLQSNVTVKLEQLKHCDKPHQVHPVTEQRRQFMLVCSRNIALVDIVDKKTIKSSGQIHDDKITQFRCSPVNFKLGCTSSLDKTLKLIDNQKCTILTSLSFDNPISCARFISAGSLLVGTLAGTIHECNIETDCKTTITDAINGPVSDVIQLEATFEYEQAVTTPTTPMTPQLNMSTMSVDSDSMSCMTPGFMANIKVRTPLAEKQLHESPLSRFDNQPRIQSTPAQKTAASSRAFFPSPAKQAPMQSSDASNELLGVLIELRKDMKEIKQTVNNLTETVTQQAEKVNQVERDVDLLKKCLVPPALQQPGPESEHEWTEHTSNLRHWHTPKQHNFYGGNFGDAVSYSQRRMGRALFNHSAFGEMRDQIALLANEAQERIDNRRDDENQNLADISILDERLHRVESQIQRAINVNGGRLMTKRWHGPSLE